MTVTNLHSQQDADNSTRAASIVRLDAVIERIVAGLKNHGKARVAAQAGILKHKLSDAGRANWNPTIGTLLKLERAVDRLDAIEAARSAGVA